MSYDANFATNTVHGNNMSRLPQALDAYFSFHEDGSRMGTKFATDEAHDALLAALEPQKGEQHPKAGRLSQDAFEVTYEQSLRYADPLPQQRLLCLLIVSFPLQWIVA